MRPLDLIAAVHALLEGPPADIEAWLAGQPSFESAVCADAATDPMLRELSGARDPPDEPRG